MTGIRRALVSGWLVAAAAGCSGRTDLERVPIGTRVEVTREDGGVIQGTLAARDDRSVQVAVGPTSRSIPRDEIASVEVMDGTTPPPLPAVARFREYTLPEGTVLAARLNTPLGSDTSHVDDPVAATLTAAALVDGVEILPSGSVITGFVTTAEPSGKVKGRASLSVQFRSVVVESRNETYGVSATLDHTAASTGVNDAKTIGIPAAGGAIVGAIVGGKKGAAIGATVGGGAGAAVVLSTSGPEVRLPLGSALSIALDDAMDVRVPIVDAPRR